MITTTTGEGVVRPTPWVASSPAISGSGSGIIIPSVPTIGSISTASLVIPSTPTARPIGAIPGGVAASVSRMLEPNRFVEQYIQQYIQQYNPSATIQITTTSPRDEVVILWQRRDRAPRYHTWLRKSGTYSYLFKQALLRRFDSLHEEFPNNQTLVRRSPTPPTLAELTNGDLPGLTAVTTETYMKTFTFDAIGNTQILCINGFRQLQFYKEFHNNNPFNGVREYSIRLVRIMGTQEHRIEKLKRLFLRHLGYDCVASKKVDTTIRINSGNSIIIKHGEGMNIPTSSTISLVGVIKEN